MREEGEQPAGFAAPAAERAGETDSPLPPALRDWLQGFNQQRRALLAEGFKLTPSNVREALDAITRRFVTSAPDIPQVLDDLVPGLSYRVPIRCYHPRPDTALPLLVLAHGGGHMAGSLSLYDPIARKLASATGHLVVSVDYRRAPECPYPLGLKDLTTVIKGVPQVLQTRGMVFEPRISLVGDSAGGALCATASHHLQFEPGIRIDRQVLIYPSLDYTLSFPSVGAKGEDLLLERERIIWYFDHYFQNEEDRRAVSPLFMAYTEELPATLVITAEHCPLRDEGLDYLRRLREAGLTAEHMHCEGMIHAFLNLEALVPEHCAAVYRRIGEFLRD